MVTSIYYVKSDKINLLKRHLLQFQFMNNIEPCLLMHCNHHDISLHLSFDGTLRSIRMIPYSCNLSSC